MVQCRVGYVKEIKELERVERNLGCRSGHIGNSGPQEREPPYSEQAKKNLTDHVPYSRIKLKQQTKVGPRSDYGRHIGERFWNVKPYHPRFLVRGSTLRTWKNIKFSVCEHHRASDTLQNYHDRVPRQHFVSSQPKSVERHKDNQNIVATAQVVENHHACTSNAL